MSSLQQSSSANSLTKAAPPQLTDVPFEPSNKNLASGVILQLFVRIVIPFVAMLLMAAVLPLTFHAVFLTLGVVGVSMFAALLFQREVSVLTVSNQEDSFLQPTNRLRLNALRNIPDTPEMPRGILNSVNGRQAANCGLNSLVQLLWACPSLLQWIYDPSSDYALGPFREFFENYAQASSERLRFIPSSSQSLREALYNMGCTEVDSNPRVQLDAGAVLTFLLSHMPLDLKGRLQEVTVLNTDGMPPLLDELDKERASRPQPFFSLELKMPPARPKNSQEPPVSLEQIVDAHCNPDFSSGSETQYVRRTTINGGTLDYPAATVRRIASPPSVLQISLGRFTKRVSDASESQANLFRRSAPAVPQMVRNRDWIDVPDDLILQTEEGPANYRLRGCFLNNTNRPTTGHYVAAVRINNQAYLCNDALVTPLTPEHWAELKGTATGLLYERAE